MNGTGFVVLMVLLIAAAIAAAIWSSKQEAKRRAALLGVAQRLGWELDPARRNVGADYEQFAALRGGHSHAAYDTLEGTVTIRGWPYPVRMGDYTYKVTSNDGKSTSTRTYNLSYLIVRLPFIDVPDLLIRRERLMDKIAGALGFDDIDFESEEFSRRFFVKCRDKKFAYDVIHPKMIEFLLEGEVPPIDLVNGGMCIVDGVRRWDPDEFEPRLKWIERFLGLWPEYLTERLDAESQPRSGDSAERI